MSAMAGPSAGPTTEHQRVLAGLSAALRNFGSLPLAGGALAQAWMPVVADDGANRVLQTKGLPYCLVGPGDMLALFRCLSCKYSFSADLKELQLLGAPGRVFVSGEAETSDNVQQCNTSVYLRVKDAQACRVSSTILLPVFAHESRSAAVAVLEITQFRSSGASYQNVFEWATANLEGAGLFAPQALETRTFEMQSHAMSIRFFSSRDSALGSMFHDTADALRPGEIEQLSSGAVSQPRAGGGAALPEAAARAGSTSLPPLLQGPASGDALSADAGQHSDAAMGPPPPQQQDMHDMGAELEGGAKPEPEADAGAELDATASLGGDEAWDGSAGSPPGQAAAAAAAAAAPPNRGILSKQDLESHFGYGLKEAARLLGVCNTTLKRACRRHGIMKWPRREMIKNARLKQEAERKAAAAAAAAAQPSPPLLLPHLGHLGRLGSGPMQLGSSAELAGAAAQQQQPPQQLPHALGGGGRAYASTAALDSLAQAHERAAQTQLRKVLSGTTLSAAAQPQRNHAASGSLSLADTKLPSFERWNALAAASSAGVISAPDVTAAPGVTTASGVTDAGEAALAERQASGVGPSSAPAAGGNLGFVDQMFADAEGLDLSSVLCDWDRHITGMGASQLAPGADVRFSRLFED